MEVVTAFIGLAVLGAALALPDLQAIIEQQRTQRAREREFLRRARMEIEA